MAINRAENIHIIMPNRIGDSIIALPFVICLKQLIEKYKKNYNVTLLTTNDMTDTYKSLDIFPVKKLSVLDILRSYIMPPDRAIFTFSYSKHFLYRGKVRYGEYNQHKPLNKFNIELPFLTIFEFKNHLPAEFIEKMKEIYALSNLSIGFLAICLKMGFTQEEIFETFEFSPNLVNTNNIKSYKLPNNDKYVVVCMEAGYGKKADSDRRWDSSGFVDVIKHVYEKFGLKSVLIGIDNSIQIPESDYIVDLRNKLSLKDTTQVIAGSVAYLGNDTGPLHIANLLKKPSIGIYFREASLVDYCPIFPDLNYKMLFPKDTQEVIDRADKLFSSINL